MSYLYCSSSVGRVGGPGFSRYFVPDFPFDQMEVEL